MAKPSGTADISKFATIELETWDGGGIYRAKAKKSRDVIGYLRYTVPLNGSRIISVTTTYTDPAWRGRKIGTALGERLHLDNPDYRLHLGIPQPEGEAGRHFWEFQRNMQPDWDATVVDREY
jgi:GNAT superfamily N-acetyltransferase